MNASKRWHASRTAIAAALVLTATVAALARPAASVPATTGRVAAADHSWAIVHTRGIGAKSEIYATYRDGRSERLTRNTTFDGFPAWSPWRDVAFVRDVGGNNAEIFTMQSNGKTVKRLTKNPGRDIYPAWSPTGNLIAFASNRAGGESEIYVMRKDGTAVRRLTKTAKHVDDIQPRFTKDGKYVVFASNRVSFFNYELFRIRVSDGGGLKRLTFWGSGEDGALGDDLMPGVSRDGKAIAFVSDRSGVYAIWTMNADGTGLREVARHQGLTTGFPRFSPDGRQLVYMTLDESKPGDARQLWTVNADGTGRKLLGKGAEPDW